jgi:hypothetical protein
MNASGNSNFERFAPRDQIMVETLEFTIETNTSQTSHIKSISDKLSTALYLSG